MKKLLLLVVLVVLFSPLVHAKKQFGGGPQVYCVDPNIKSVYTLLNYACVPPSFEITDENFSKYNICRKSIWDKSIFGESNCKYGDNYKDFDINSCRGYTNKIGIDRSACEWKKVAKQKTKTTITNNLNKPLLYCKQYEDNIYATYGFIIGESKCPFGDKQVTKKEYDDFIAKKNISNTTKVVKKETTTTTPKKKTEQVVVTTSNLDKKSLKEELKYWKELFDDELISKEEYDAKRKELLSGASITTTTKVVEPKVEKKKVVTQTQEVKSDNTKTIDISFKSKNYVSQSLLGSLGFFANDGKIKDYCEDKYPKLHVYMECYAQNLKKSKVYKKARNLYDIYIELGRHLAWESVLGHISDSSARYQLATKRQEMNDAYTEDNSKKWRNIANALDEIKERHYPTPPPPEKSNKQTCDINYFNGKATSMTCK